MLLNNLKKVSLIFLALAASPAHGAYRHVIQNETPFLAKVTIRYATIVCSNEKFDLNPGEETTRKAGTCGILSINATLDPNGKAPIEAQGYSHAVFWGNGTWQIAPDATNPNKFSIVQTKSENLGKIISDRFGDTQTTRAIDYGIRKAGLLSALSIATASLDAAKAVTQGSLAAAREIAHASLTASQQILKLSGNVSAGAMRGSADAAQSVLEGAKIGTVSALEGAKVIISKGPLSWIDINEMKYVGNYKELKTGVLGNITVQAELFGKPVPLSLSIDPSSPNLEALYTKSFKPIVDALVDSLKEAIVGPVKEETKKADQTLKVTNKLLAATTQLPPSAQIEKTVNIALKSSADINKQHNEATVTIQKILDQTQKKAEQALVQAKQ